MTSEHGNLSSFSRVPSAASPYAIVGHESHLPITHTSTTSLNFPDHSFWLNNVIVTPSLIKNLISVRQFTLGNHCSIEFDPYGLSVKDLHTKNVIIRCNSRGDLYPLHWLPPAPCAFSITTPSSTVWHRRLGHLGNQALSHLASASYISYTKISTDTLCHACQLGRHVCLPFSPSTRTNKAFDLIHCDLWTSSVPSVSGYKYYLVVLDDFTHYL